MGATYAKLHVSFAMMRGGLKNEAAALGPNVVSFTFGETSQAGRANPCSGAPPFGLQSIARSRTY
jgi:glycerol uptake facilitator-like aquaporin